MGGRSHAAWNENGVLLFATWDPVAGRWGDAAQIANATDARNIQLTPGRIQGSTQPVLLASWGPTGFGETCPGVPAWATLVEYFPDPAVVWDPALRQAIIALAAQYGRYGYRPVTGLLWQ